MDVILVLKIFLAVVLFCIVIFVIRWLSALRKVKRIGYYSLEPLKDNSLSITDKIIDKYIKQFNDFYEHIIIDKYVIMPNHVHLIILVENGASGTSPPTKQHSVISQFISTLKRFVNKEIGYNIFQRSFHDHVIRDQDDYLKIWNYIDENPAKWQEDKYYQ